jgi:hypothetical protein
MVNASAKSDLSQPASVPEVGAGNVGSAVLFRISADGTWFYRGSAIQRPEMVQLFATALRRESRGFMLVTPYERHVVAVDDAPFIAVALRRENDGHAQRLIFTTNVDHEVVLSPEHPLVVRGTRDQPRPYVVVAPGIEARIARSVYYELAALAETEAGGKADSPLGVISAGAFFRLEPAA